ncbi:MAG: NAD(P)H-dependent oxidoreductase [Bdellovibrionales bacterium]|nr:NAD(P)H-dependent oxidoreductase [Bdellovibrionales bacterium]
MKSLIDSMNWRYATKQFDPEKKLSDEVRDALAESLRLTASSFGLQAWKFLFIRSQEVKELLKPATFNQNQITDCSDVVVLTAPREVGEVQIDRYIHHMAQVRQVDVSTLDGFKGYLAGFIKNKSENDVAQWVDKQIYIALGNLLTSAAILQVDTCAIEGFKSSAYDDILKLKENGLRSVVVCALGYRQSADKHATHLKVRFPINEVVEYI